jgi:hypothetical protein
LTWSSRSYKVARQTSQQANPINSCLVLKAANAASSSMTGTAPSDVAANRYGDTRRAAREGSAGARRLAAQGRGDQRRQGDKLASKSAGSRLVLVSLGGRRWGPSASAGRSTTVNPLPPGARACRLGGPAAWGPMPASSARVSLRALHLTGTGRLWMARLRLLLLRSEGKVGRRGRRS